jgi:phosphohistidine phosphatase
MKRLFLLRHAKAVPAESGVEDFERTLMLVGMQDAGAIARYLHKNGYRPDLILCSSAARTAQTGELVVQQLECEIEYRESLYLAEPQKILAAVRAAPATLSSLMVVGHNPGLEALASLLAREPVRRKERARHEALEEKFPTCALAILDFDAGRWRDVAPGTGKLVDFVRPKDV